MGMTKERVIARIAKLKAQGALENDRLIKKWERKLRKIDG